MLLIQHNQHSNRIKVLNDIIVLQFCRNHPIYVNWVWLHHLLLKRNLIMDICHLKVSDSTLIQIHQPPFMVIQHLNQCGILLNYLMPILQNIHLKQLIMCILLTNYMSKLVYQFYLIFIHVDLKIFCHLKLIGQFF